MNMATARIVRRYRLWASITIGAVVLLMLVGAIVRMTGSGMGCPDWPKCFGQWVPPTDISQLPTDYKSQFQVAGKEIADFDPFKTWVEYINRLIGVAIGILALITFVRSLSMKKIRSSVFWLSLAGLILIAIQGGIGAIVVRTNLEVGMITLHMMIAMGILAVYIAALTEAFHPWFEEKRKRIQAVPPSLLWLSMGVTGIILLQIMWGTQVREEIDAIALQLGEANRANWISSLGSVYGIHRIFYYAVVLVLGSFIYTLRPWIKQSGLIRKVSALLIATLLGEILLGLGMHHLGIPAWIQPLHLLFATVIFGSSLGLNLILFKLKKREIPIAENNINDHSRNTETVLS